MSEAMQFARSAVKNNPAAGLCVGALARACRRNSEVVNAGDTAILTYDPASSVLEFPVEVQTDVSSGGDPANYLGRKIGRLPEPITDSVGSVPSLRGGVELYLMSDGVFGNWAYGTDLNDYHFEAAHDAYLLLDDALRHDPILYKKYLDQRLNWDQWSDEVQPYIEKHYPPRSPIGRRAICQALIERKIAWEFERSRSDDATVIMVSESE